VYIDYKQDHVIVPPSVRDLVKRLVDAGFSERGGKGSHRNFIHPRVSRPITISGKMSDDGKHYQIRAVEKALEELKQ